ncbi:MtrAB system histidine kinase MtrB [Metallococcus carri]|uniref:MtrAB system histidine kinase MtrB n=1 Tax=Metallococcus carri TaxID=1656884 RepID=UPI0038B3889E
MKPDPPEPTAPQRSTLAGAAATLRRLLVAGARWLYRLWRRSLHVRVVTITVLAGTILVLSIGSYMYQRIADGLVNSKMASAEQETQARRYEAQSLFDNTDHTDPSSLRQLATDMVQQIASPGDDRSRRVIVLQSLGNTARPIAKVSSDRDTPPELIPNGLREALRGDPTHQQVQILTVRSAAGGTVPAVVIGSRIQMANAGPYDLFLVYPMDDELHTLGIIQGSFLLGGLLILLVLAALAYLVTRMVVTPVRAAAHVAERLSAGALNERMRARGEDDVARLALSFNSMADSMQRQIRQLEDLSTLQQRFTSDVSHELRTPLTTVRMAADMLHDHRADFTAPVARSAELLVSQLDRFEALLTDLLEISRFDAGAAAVQTEPVDLREVVQRVVETARPLAERSGSRLRVSARRPAVAPMDQRRVERIVRNLVTNAIDHGEGRPVDIRVGVNATAVAVSVRDYGVGLNPGDEARVFGRFWRADPARARTTGGTGLGLSIALEDARLHDGWLQAWGEKGSGSCFRLTLPSRAGVPIERSPLPLAPDDSQVGRIMPAGNSLTLGAAGATGEGPKRWMAP